MSTKISHQKYEKETLLSQQQMSEQAESRKERSQRRGADKRADKAERKSK